MTNRYILYHNVSVTPMMALSIFKSTRQGSALCLAQLVLLSFRWCWQQQQPWPVDANLLCIVDELIQKHSSQCEGDYKMTKAGKATRLTLQPQ